MKNPLSRVLGRKDQREKRLSPDGLQVAEFPAGVTQLLRVDGLVGSNYARIYATQPNVRTVVDTIAREGAELTMKMYEKVERGEDQPSARITLSDHPMIVLLDEPAPGMSTYRFWFASFADIAIYDVALWLKIKRGGVTAALVRIPPMNLVPVRDPITGAVISWRANNGQEFSPDQLVVFWGYDPAVGHGYIPPMESVRRLISDEAQAAADRAGRWAKGLRRDGIIEPSADSPKMSDDAMESYLIDLEDALAGPSNSGRPAVLQPGHTWKESTWSPKEMEWLEARKLSRVEAASAWHMPAKMVDADGDPDEATLRVFYRSTLRPFLARIEGEVEAQLLPDFDMVPAVRRQRYVEFNLDAKMRGSFDELAAIGSTAVGGPFITVNEYRARLNLPPVDGGDEMFVPLNSIRGGGPQASPQSPIQTPATGPEPVGTTPGGGTAPGGASSENRDPAKTMRDLVAVADEKASSNAFARELIELRPKYERVFDTTMARTFDRQRSAVGTGRELKLERWDRELADDLFKAMYPIVGAIGDKAAAHVGTTFDHERTANYLKERARFSAAAINLQTNAALDTDEPNLDAIFGDARVEKLAIEFSTWALSWAQMEVAHQAGEIPDGKHR